MKWFRTYKRPSYQSFTLQKKKKQGNKNNDQQNSGDISIMNLRKKQIGRLIIKEAKYLFCQVKETNNGNESLL